MLNNKGPNIDPWGTPLFMVTHSLHLPITLVLWRRLHKKLMIKLHACLDTPYADSLAIKSPCGMLSKAFDNIFYLSPRSKKHDGIVNQWHAVMDCVGTHPD